MGCWASRPAETALMALCRSRRVLIREAIGHRYALAAAHDSYFRSLSAVGDALLRYAREGIPVATEPAAQVVTLPDSRKSNDGDGSGGSSATPLSHSLSDEGSHLQISSDSETEGEADQGKGGNQSAGPNPDHSYMRSSSATPNVVYGDSYGGLYEGFVNDPNYYYGWSASPPPPTRVATPPPPPPQGSSAWDFLDPFSSYEQFLPGYFSGQYRTASFGSSSNSSEVREREVPDLEEETEPEGLTRVKKGKMIAEDFGEKGSGIGSSKTLRAKKTDDLEKKSRKLGSGDKASKLSPTEKGSNGSSSTSLVSSGEKASKVSPSEKGSKGSSSTSFVGSNGEQGSSLKKKGVTFEKGTSLVNERSGSTDGGLSSMEGSKDVVEATGDIKEEFKSAITGNDEVSKLLEVGKVPYRPRNKVFKVISSRILVCVGFRMPSRRLFKHRRRLAATTMNNRSINVEFEKHVSVKSGHLSSTLEKLFLWEKKLYEEVKAEERLRGIHEKKLRRLKSLDERGAELHKINATQVSARSVRTKMSIAITSVDAISRRMCRIMDEELQPQLVKLIRRLTQMWKLLLGCHQKQLQSIIASKNYKLSIRTSFQDSATKATMHLELALLKWHASFDEWISSQKSFVNSLNGWLSKWLPKNREGTPDGIPPFSPAARAPSLFVLTNDWSRAINTISEVDDVKAAIQNFAANMHRLWESQDEEQKLQQRADFLSKEYSAKLSSLQMEHGDRDLSIRNTENTSYFDERVTALDSMKKRLDEVRAKHVETLRQVEQVSSASLRSGLVPVFQSLVGFSSEILRAHEALRFPNNGGSG
ncbi:uncharacterized protein LOC110018195 [Phalaenopsis equestris]|uniref:uncharacterized protein LOC110018195 n=1 Tax=Phalaenopsis equestris TaxID=78828 RepID=UPI0009E646AC|nr:uncharacterized protein LOC110018195 [Phalaenopsis equestris]